MTRLVVIKSHSQENIPVIRGHLPVPVRLPVPVPEINLALVASGETTLWYVRAISGIGTSWGKSLLQKPCFPLVRGLCAGETPALQGAEVYCRAGVPPA